MNARETTDGAVSPDEVNPVNDVNAVSSVNALSPVSDGASAAQQVAVTLFDVGAARNVYVPRTRASPYWLVPSGFLLLARTSGSN